VIERAVILSDGDIFSVDETWLKRQPHQVAAAPAIALRGVLHKQGFARLSQLQRIFLVLQEFLKNQDRRQS
jgi:hypothetical protein